MFKCTAPVNGHHSEYARMTCPRCRSRFVYTHRTEDYRQWPSLSYEERYSTPQNKTIVHDYLLQPGTAKAKWSVSGSSVLYTYRELRVLTPVRREVERRSLTPKIFDFVIIYCRDAEQIVSGQISGILDPSGKSVVLREIEVVNGKIIAGEIEIDLELCCVGVLLVTPDLIELLQRMDHRNAIHTLLAVNHLIPVIHRTSDDKICEVSPLLASRAGLNTAQLTVADLAEKLMELVRV